MMSKVGSFEVMSKVGGSDVTFVATSLDVAGARDRDL